VPAPNERLATNPIVVQVLYDLSSTTTALLFEYLRTICSELAGQGRRELALGEHPDVR